MRKERELSFYGEIDFIPTEEYTREEAKEFIEQGKKILNIAERLFET